MPTFAERYGPWAVVAGACEGTGRVLAREICARGVPCILVARRLAPQQALAEENQSDLGVECIAPAIDLSNADAFEQVADAVGGRQVGLFVGNAGADPNGAHFLDREVEAWTQLLARNLTTTLRACHHFGA